MASIINASTTSTSGLVYTADASGILQLQSNGTTGLTVEANASVTVNTILQTPNGRVEPLVLGTAKASTSGTTVDFTSIPGWVRRITVMLSGVSTSGTSNWLIQIGTSGGVENTGYLGVGTWTGSTSSGTNYTAGFGLLIGSATHVIHGTVVLTLLSAATNTWTCAGSFGGTGGGAGFIYSTSGAKSLTGTLDRVRLTTVNGTDTFDAGTINIMYE